MFYNNIFNIEKENKKIDLKYILVVLNSTLISYYFMKNTAKSVRKLFPKIILNDLRKFPFKEISLKEQQPFIEKANKILTLNKELQEIVKKEIERSRTLSDEYRLKQLEQVLFELKQLQKDLSYKLSFPRFIVDQWESDNPLTDLLLVYSQGIEKMQKEKKKCI